MPYLEVAKNIFADIYGWILGLIFSLMVLMIGVNVFKAIKGDNNKKKEARETIISIVSWGGGIFAIVWIAGYVFNAMKAV